MQTFLTIIAVLICSTFLTVVFMVGGIDYLLEKYEMKKKDENKK